MPRVRFSIRWLMVVVAIVAVAIWGEQTRRRRAEYRLRAAEYARFERVLFDGLPGYGLAAGDPRAATFLYGEEKRRGQAEYCSAMRKKYEHAARHPWLPVSADPPVP